MFVLLPMTPIQYFWAAINTVLLASAPDWDLRVGIRHRTITHSLLIPLGLFIAAVFAPPYYKDILYTASLVLINHDILDLFTWAGVPLFYPLSKHKFKLYIWSIIPGFSNLDYDKQKRIYTAIVNILCVVIVGLAIFLQRPFVSP